MLVGRRGEATLAASIAVGLAVTPEVMVLQVDVPTGAQADIDPVGRRAATARTAGTVTAGAAASRLPGPECAGPRHDGAAARRRRGVGTADRLTADAQFPRVAGFQALPARTVALQRAGAAGGRGGRHRLTTPFGREGPHRCSAATEHDQGFEAQPHSEVSPVARI